MCVCVCVCVCVLQIGHSAFNYTQIILKHPRYKRLAAKRHKYTHMKERWCVLYMYMYIYILRERERE